jgi:hypothetical protein
MFRVLLTERDNPVTGLYANPSRKLKLNCEVKNIFLKNARRKEMEPRHLPSVRTCVTLHHMHWAMPTLLRSYESAANTNLQRRNIMFCSAINPHTITGICTIQITKETNFEILATFSVYGWKYLRPKCKASLLATKQHAMSIGTNGL